MYSFMESVKKLTVAGTVSASILTLTAFLGCVIGAYDLGIAGLYLIPYISVPALIICAFGFLFKRKACDLYFALPVKRETLFLKNLFSVALWTVISYALPIWVVGINTGFSYIVSEYGGTFICHLATCLYIAGGTCVAIFLTGRVLSAIINSVIIAIIPRFAYLVVLNGIFDKYSFLVKNAPGLPNLSTDSYLTMGFIESESVNYIIVGIFLLIISLVLFKKRKSETAGQSAPNNFLKIIYSALIAFSVSLTSLSHFINRYGMLSSMGDSMAIVLLGISLLIPFLYQLTALKKIKLKFTVFSFVALIFLNGLTLISYYSGCAYTENQHIDVKGYQIINYSRQDEAKARGSEYIYVWGDYDDGDFAYNQLLVNEYFLKNPQNLEMLENRLDEIRKREFKYVDKYNEYIVALLDEKGKVHYRYLPITADEMDTLWYYETTSDEAFINLTSQMPAPEEIKKANSFGDKNFDKKLYETLYGEMMALSPQERISLTYTVDNNCNEYMPQNILRSITVEGVRNGKKYTSIYAISEELCPEAYKLAKERAYEENSLKIKKILASSQNDYVDFVLQLEAMPQENKYENPVPYVIRAEKTSGYKITKTNENISWKVTDDEFVKKEEYTEQDNERVQRFFDILSPKCSNYDAKESYNTKLIINYKNNELDAKHSLSYEFNLSYEEFKKIYKLLEREDF